jgi:hypothetical protein
MWCTEVAASAFLTVRSVVSGDIGDHGRSCDLPQPIHLFCRPAAAEKNRPATWPL